MGEKGAQRWWHTVCLEGGTVQTQATTIAGSGSSTPDQTPPFQFLALRESSRREVKGATRSGYDEGERRKERAGRC